MVKGVEGKGQVSAGKAEVEGSELAKRASLDNNSPGGLTLDERLANTQAQIAELEAQLAPLATAQYNLLFQKFMSPQERALVRLQKNYSASPKQDIKKLKSEFPEDEHDFFDKFMAAIEKGDSNGLRTHYCQMDILNPGEHNVGKHFFILHELKLGRNADLFKIQTLRDLTRPDPVNVEAHDFLHKLDQQVQYIEREFLTE